MNTLTFWGVQGSCPGAVNQCDDYGHNTSCISVEHNNQLIIFDAGTGIRNLSENLDFSAYRNVVLLLTHAHWDHIQGFPFFNYIYTNKSLDIFCHDSNHANILLSQMNGINFPIQLSDLPCSINTISDINKFRAKYGYSLEFISTNHPGNCIGYRLKHSDFDICYIPDNQLRKTLKEPALIDQFSGFCKETNILIHDSQFTENDMPKKQNWGHSIFTDTFELAKKAKAGSLVLFHHDQFRKPGDIDFKVNYCNKQKTSISVIAAKENQKIPLLGN